MDIDFEFTGHLWETASVVSWVFVTLPVDDADEIQELVPERRGFGSVRVEVTIVPVVWSTSIFPDKAHGSYVLPVKRSVREAAGVDVGDVVDVTLKIVES